MKLQNRGFQAATRILRVNCVEMAGNRPRQPAYEIFSMEY